MYMHRCTCTTCLYVWVCIRIQQGCIGWVMETRDSCSTDSGASVYVFVVGAELCFWQGRCWSIEIPYVSVSSQRSRWVALLAISSCLVFAGDHHFEPLVHFYLPLRPDSASRFLGQLDDSVVQALWILTTLLPCDLQYLAESAWFLLVPSYLKHLLPTVVQPAGHFVGTVFARREQVVRQSFVLLLLSAIYVKMYTCEHATNNYDINQT